MKINLFKNNQCQNNEFQKIQIKIIESLVTTGQVENFSENMILANTWIESLFMMKLKISVVDLIYRSNFLKTLNQDMIDWIDSSKNLDSSLQNARKIIVTMV